MGQKVRKIVTSLVDLDVRLAELDFHPETTVIDRKRRKYYQKQFTMKEIGERQADRRVRAIKGKWAAPQHTPEANQDVVAKQSRKKIPKPNALKTY
jgi:hypothetical protein